MKKTIYRDYAVSAFIFFGRVGTPSDTQTAVHNLQAYLLKNNIKISDEQFMASLNDILACIETLKDIDTMKDARELKEAIGIYTSISTGGSVTEQITRHSVDRYTSEASLYRRLQTCRELFAKHRGLRTSA